MGFEPTEPFRVHSISNAANSTTLAPFQNNCEFQITNYELKTASVIRNLKFVIRFLAERVGFEPTEPVKVQQFSRLPDSTTLAPLRELNSSLAKLSEKIQVSIKLLTF